MWMAAALTMILTLVIVRRGLKLRPDGKQTAAEVVYDLCRNQIAEGRAARRGHADLVPVRGDALRVHLDDEPDRVHPAAVRRAPLRALRAQHPRVPDLRGHRQPVGHPRAHAGHLLRDPHRGHPLQRPGQVLQELDAVGPAVAAAVGPEDPRRGDPARADRRDRGALAVRPHRLAQLPSLFQPPRRPPRDRRVPRPRVAARDVLHPADRDPHGRRPVPARVPR